MHHKRGIEDLGKLDQPGAVAESAAQVTGQADRQPGLADAPRPDQADDASVGELLLDLRQFVSAADEGAHLGRDVASAPGGPRHSLECTRPLYPIRPTRYRIGNLTDARAT